MKPLPNVFQFQAMLEHIEPGIWRRIQVSDDYTLAQLHLVLQLAMGWENSHLHEFQFDGKRYGEPDPDDEENIVDENTVRLRDLRLSLGDSIGYLYDFGDDWQHRLKLEAILPPAPELRYPTCLSGERRCPPEDVGGTDGYAEFLSAIGDPEHEDHEATLTWRGEDFNPEAFSVTAVNRKLRRVLSAKK